MGSLQNTYRKFLWPNPLSNTILVSCTLIVWSYHQRFLSWFFENPCLLLSLAYGPYYPFVLYTLHCHRICLPADDEPDSFSQSSSVSFCTCEENSCKLGNILASASWLLICIYWIVRNILWWTYRKTFYGFVQDLWNPYFLLRGGLLHFDVCHESGIS